MDTKEAKVIEAVNSEEVVIDQGSSSGVKVGDGFIVFELGNEAVDPRTNESLGKTKLIKGEGIVVSVASSTAIVKAIITADRIPNVTLNGYEAPEEKTSEGTVLCKEEGDPAAELLDSIRQVLLKRQKRVFKHPNIGDMAEKVNV